MKIFHDDWNFVHNNEIAQLSIFIGRIKWLMKKRNI